MQNFRSSPWPCVPLKSICELTETFDPRRERDRLFRYVDIASIENAGRRIVDTKEFPGKDAPSRARKRIRVDDVVFATTRPYLRGIAKVPLELDNQVCSTGLCVIRSKGTVLPDWLFYGVQSEGFLGQVLPKMRGASYPAVTDRDVYEAVIPVPPLPEQRRIVVRIQECLARVEEMETLQSELSSATEAALASALAAFFSEVDARYPPAAINDVTVESAYGTNQKCSASGAGLPVLRIPNIQPGQIDLSDLKYAELRPSEVRKVLLSPGDLLIVRTNGSPSLVGRCAVFEEQSRFGYASYLIRFRLRRDLCIPAYLSFYLASTTGRDAISRIRRTSAGQFNINSENIRSIRFPLPPLDEQARLVESMTAISLTVRRLQAELDDHSVSAPVLRNSILEKAFAGEL